MPHRQSPLKSPECESQLAAVEALMHELANGSETSDVLGSIVAEHLRTGGKRLRARLALASVSSLGASMADAVGWAAACEIAHNATLIHDDLQDGDRMRRGHPTTWVQHGAAQAINAGDLLFMLPLLAVEQIPRSGDVKSALCVAIGRRIAEVCRGQAAELAMTQAGDTTPATYNRAIVGKTSALFQLPVEGGALLAGYDAAAAKRMAEPFEPLGILFQMQDDVLDLYGDKGRDVVGSDLKEGKISALVVEHLRGSPDDRPWLIEVLRTPRYQTQDADVHSAIARFEKSGALATVLDRIQQEAERVRSHGVWQQHPGLFALADELVELVLKPIAHLRSKP